jgi:hypothetical protein
MQMKLLDNSMTCCYEDCASYKADPIRLWFFENGAYQIPVFINNKNVGYITGDTWVKATVLYMRTTTFFIRRATMLLINIRTGCETDFQKDVRYVMRKACSALKNLTKNK